MKNLNFKAVCIVLIIILAMAIMPISVKAAENADGIVLEKASGEKIIYIKGMEATEFQYAFSDEIDTSKAAYITASKDTNGEYVGYLEAEETYKYMFISDDANTEKTKTLQLDELKKITDENSKYIESFTKRIKIKSDESESNVTKEEKTVITNIRGKIVITDEGDYQYQLIKVEEKNNTALELYNQMLALANTDKMYDKLLVESTILNDYYKLIEDAQWEDAKNKEILQQQDSQNGEKFLVLIQEVKDGKTIRNDIQFMICGREDAADVELRETQTTKMVERRTQLPVTGENIALYIILGVIILAIIILVIKMKKDENNKKK